MIKARNFVTGASGMTGAHLVKALLERGEEVVAIKRPQSNLSFIQSLIDNPSLFDKIEWVDGDLMDVTAMDDAMAGCQRIFHTAAIVSFEPSKRHEVIRQNVEGTANLVNCALDHQINHFIHLSSVAALGIEKDGKPVDEESPWKYDPSDSGYRISKHYSEREVWRGSEEGLQVSILNPCIIIGPGDWKRSSSAMFSQINAGLKYYTPGENAFIDVRDVVKAMLFVADEKIVNERFVLAAEMLPFKVVFDQIADAIGAARPTKLAKRWMTSIIWRIEFVRSLLTGSKPVITKESADTAFKKKVYSSRKWLETTGLSFTPINESIEYTATFFRRDH